jgi:glycosyltransferase involved in cell wall biosynthesis
MMIVRNETRTIPRLIESVLPIVSSWLIIDTGSDDGTPELTIKLLGHLPGRLLHKQWINFGHNRSELVKLIPQDADYALLLDADHVLELESLEEFIQEIQLNSEFDCLMVNVSDRDFTYSMPYLVKAGPKYQYVGATHEYLSADKTITRSLPLKTVRIIHLADGGSKSDKFARDKRLLEEEILRGDDNSRNRFYLGQTYENLGFSELAIEQYKVCVSKSAWDEEKYVALLRAGRLTRSKHQGTEALTLFLQAHETCPDRSEALYEIVKELKVLGAYKLAHRILKSPGYATKHRIMFIENWIVDIGLPIESGVVAWHVGHVSEAKEIFLSLLNRPNLKPETKELLIKNLTYCT